MFDERIQVPIGAPPSRVFETLTDVRRLHEWQVEVIEATVIQGGALRPGVRVREVRRVGGRRVEQLVEVAVHEPPHRLGLRILEGPVRIHGDWVAEDDGAGGTVLHVHAFGALPFPLRLAAPLVATLARRQLRRQHDRLRVLVETAAVPASR